MVAFLSWAQKTAWRCHAASAEPTRRRLHVLTSTARTEAAPRGSAQSCRMSVAVHMRRWYAGEHASLGQRQRFANMTRVRSEGDGSRAYQDHRRRFRLI